MLTHHWASRVHHSHHFHLGHLSHLGGYGPLGWLGVGLTLVIVLCALIILVLKVGSRLARRAEQRRTAATWQQPYQQPFGYYGTPTSPMPPQQQQPPPTWNYPDQR